MFKKIFPVLFILVSCKDTVVRENFNTNATNSTSVWIFAGPSGMPRTVSSFSSAKSHLKKIYLEAARTLGIIHSFYCSCVITFKTDKNINLYIRKADTDVGCGFSPKHPILFKGGTETKYSIEWEHVVPAYEFGHNLPCWSSKSCVDSHGKAYGGRACCRKKDIIFRHMEADMVNLKPALAELNRARSNFKYGEVKGEPRDWGACDFEIDLKTKIAEPPFDKRGDVARVYLYMYYAYPGRLKLTKEQISRFVKDSHSDPPTAYEKTVNKLIGKVQGQGNPLIGN